MTEEMTWNGKPLSWWESKPKCMKFKRLADGLYVEPDTGVELVRTLDDSDGYERREWTVWTPQRGRCVAMVPTFAEARTRARALRAEGNL